MSFSFSKASGSHIFLADELGIAGRDVHGNVVHQALEVVGAGHEIALAVHFHQHADFASGVDVAGHRAFAGNASGLLGGGGHALLAENDDGAFHVALGLGEGVLAVHHGSVGLLAKLFHLCGSNVHGCRTHLWNYSYLLFQLRLSIRFTPCAKRPAPCSARVMNRRSREGCDVPGKPCDCASRSAFTRGYFPRGRAARLCPAPLPC